MLKETRSSYYNDQTGWYCMLHEKLHILNLLSALGNCFEIYSRVWA
jgi:hypothetical protein